MPKQYYGDRAAEKDRKIRFERFKSHIIQKPIKTYSEDGTERTI